MVNGLSLNEIIRAINIEWRTGVANVIAGQLGSQRDSIFVMEAVDPADVVLHDVLLTLLDTGTQEGVIYLGLTRLGWRCGIAAIGKRRRISVVMAVKAFRFVRDGLTLRIF
jgi:hypothetical protein